MLWRTERKTSQCNQTELTKPNLNDIWVAYRFSIKWKDKVPAMARHSLSSLPSSPPPTPPPALPGNTETLQQNATQQCGYFSWQLNGKKEWQVQSLCFVLQQVTLTQMNLMSTESSQYTVSARIQASASAPLLLQVSSLLLSSPRNLVRVSPQRCTESPTRTLSAGSYWSVTSSTDLRTFWSSEFLLNAFFYCEWFLDLLNTSFTRARKVLVWILWRLLYFKHQ